MSHSVYISYAVRDKVVADAACACLEARGIRCWIAPRDMPPGLSRADALARAIGAAGVFVLVWSASSNASEQVIREVALATEARIPVLPFRIQDVQPSKEIGYFVRTIHWLDALTSPLEKHLRTLADSVQRLLGIPHLEAAPDQAVQHVVHAPPAPQPQPPGYDVFISYRRDKDSQTARLIRAELQQRGFKVFLDVEISGRDISTRPFSGASRRHRTSS